jgi:hypothetical protein
VLEIIAMFGAGRVRFLHTEYLMRQFRNATAAERQTGENGVTDARAITTLPLFAA